MKLWKLTACLLMLPVGGFAGPPDIVVVRHCAVNENDGQGYNDAVLQACLGQVVEFCMAEGGADQAGCLAREEKAWNEYMAEGQQWLEMRADAATLDALKAEQSDWEQSRDAACTDGVDEASIQCRRDKSAERALQLYFRGKE